MKTTLTTLILSLFALAATRIVAVEGAAAGPGCGTKPACTCADCKCTGAEGDACKCKAACGTKPACTCADCKCAGAAGDACKCKAVCDKAACNCEKCCREGCQKPAAAVKAGCCDKPKA